MGGVKSFLRDIRFGFRLLRKNVGVAAVAVLALPLGIGANTAIYSIVYAAMFEGYAGILLRDWAAVLIGTRFPAGGR
jgi:hypothetical protein